MSRRPGIDRREFLRLGGSSLVLLGLGPAGRAGARSAAPAAAPTAAPLARGGVLVVFFQRGAADGLHIAAPYRDRDYRRLRGALALAEPGSAEGSSIDLGDGFAFHPELAPLHPAYAAGKLVVVQAVGSTDPTRSHFDGQDYMESGTPGQKYTRDGWLGRALKAMLARDGATPSPFVAVALTPGLPRSFAGCTEVLAMTDFKRLDRTRDASLEERIERMYDLERDPELKAAGSEAFRAVEMFRARDPLAIPVRPGVSYPGGRLGQRFSQVARLIKADLGVRVAFLDGGGWDTHFNQGAVRGRMANELSELGGSIAAFLADLGPDSPVTLLTATEFGRTVAPNGAGGSDHGHGAAMLVAGRGVRGGRVAGDWPGLRDLHQGRDLQVTTDFRALFHEVATRSLGLPAATELFPGFRPVTLPGVMLG